MSGLSYRACTHECLAQVLAEADYSDKKDSELNIFCQSWPFREITKWIDITLTVVSNLEMELFVDLMFYS